jgi:translation initiation factor eIF-2B subunit epsilon
MPTKQQNKFTDEILQSVVIADSFNRRFHPLELQLLPLANTPLIEYTLECLASNNVDQIIVVSRSETVKEYIRHSKWSKAPGPEIVLVGSEHYKSVGDVLRDLDEKQLLISDFILVQGDLVSNARLTESLNAHRARRETNKNAIMTMVLKQASSLHPSRYLS